MSLTLDFVTLVGIYFVSVARLYKLIGFYRG